MLVEDQRRRVVAELVVAGGDVHRAPALFADLIAGAELDPRGALLATWVISLHGLLSTSYSKSGQQIPFFMMPSLGGGDNLRAFTSWRFRDLNSLLLQLVQLGLISQHLI